MAPDAHANLAVSTVATAPSPATSGTSLTVASGEGSRFPAVPFNATVRPIGAQPDPSNAEIIRVTARSTDSFGTIVRAQEGTTARAIQVGDHISATVTAKTLTDVEGDVTTGFSMYKQVVPWRGGLIAAAKAAGTYVVLPYNSDTLVTNDLAGIGAVWLDPADYSGGSGRTTKYRVRATLKTNSVSMGTWSITFGLYGVATVGGGSGAATLTLDAVTSGSTAAFTNPGTSTPLQANSGDFTAPATAKDYVIGFVTTGTPATNSRAVWSVCLESRPV